MSFIIQSLLKNFIPPTQNGNKLTFFHQGPDMQLNPSQSFRLPLGFSLNSLPANQSLQLTPHESLLHSGISSLLRNFDSSDYGSELTNEFSNNSNQQKTIRRGDSIFHGVLKTVGSAAMSILPFVGEDQQENVVQKSKKIYKRRRL